MGSDGRSLNQLFDTGFSSARSGMGGELSSISDSDDGSSSSSSSESGSVTDAPSQNSVQ